MSIFLLGLFDMTAVYTAAGFFVCLSDSLKLFINYY